MTIKNFTFIAMFIFIVSSCCKKEEGATQETKSTTVSKDEQEETATLERLAPDAYAKRMGSIKVQLIDLRSPKEFKQGHIENAENINVLDGDFIDKITAYKKDVPVYVYCTHGQERSEKAAKIFKKRGYVVTILDGGLDEWTEKGHKVIK